MLKKIQPQMPELQFLERLIFPRALKKLENWVNFSFSSHLKFFSVYIIKKMTFVVSVKPNQIEKKVKKNIKKISASA